MNKPTANHEIIIELYQHEEGVLIFHVATNRALEWIKKEHVQYAADNGMQNSIIEALRVPCMFGAKISPCFNINEVREYLSNPVFTDSQPIKLVTGEDK